MVGEGLDWAVTTLLGDVGAHILAIFLFLAGVLLLTGASVAGVIKATTDSVSTTTRELRAAVGRDAQRARRPAPTSVRWRARAVHELRSRALTARARAPEVDEPPEVDSRATSRAGAASQSP